MAACDDDDNDKNSRNLEDADETFVEKAALSNMTEIDFANLALTNAQHDSVRAFAQHMTEEHSTAQNELKTMADKFEDVDWPTEMDQQHQQLKQQLMSLSGYQFDSAYMQSQVNDHQAALNLFNTEKNNGKNSDVKGYANKYQPHIQDHLDMADSVLNMVLASDDNGVDDGN